MGHGLHANRPKVLHAMILCVSTSPLNALTRLYDVRGRYTFSTCGLVHALVRVMPM